MIRATCERSEHEVSTKNWKFTVNVNVTTPLMLKQDGILYFPINAIFSENNVIFQ